MVDNKEKALRTYLILKKRKERRKALERQQRDDYYGILFRDIQRANKK